MRFITLKNTSPMMLFAPWLIGVVTIILSGLMITLAVSNAKRVRNHAPQMLTEKGNALINTFESAVRTGMEMDWSGEQLKYLLKEVALQPDIAYIMVTDGRGRILASSLKGQEGQQFVSVGLMNRLYPGTTAQWNIEEVAHGRKIFQVYRFFQPEILHSNILALKSGMSDGKNIVTMQAPVWGPLHQMQYLSDFANENKELVNKQVKNEVVENTESIVFYDSTIPPPPLAAKRKDEVNLRMPPSIDRQVIFVGYDATVFEEALQADGLNTILISAVFVFLGLAGSVSAVWAYRYGLSLRVVLDTKAIAEKVMDSLPVGLFTTDAEERITYFNPAAKDISGVRRVTALGRNPSFVLGDAWHELCSGLRAGKTILEYEIRCKCASGRRVPLSLSASGIITEDSRRLGYIVLMRDLGEVQRLQAVIRRSERLAALGTLAAGVAHEIRNPLSTLKGFTLFLSNKFQVDTPELRAVQVMGQEVERLNRVVGELLEFARPSQLSIKKVDLKNFLEQSLELVGQDIANKQIIIKKEIDNNLPLIPLDKDRMTQALINLYLNAVQAMNMGKILTVRAKLDPNNISVDNNGQDVFTKNKLMILIEIEDQGKGIPPENLGKLFSPYFTTKPSGAGLGLAIVHKIIEAHEGNIEVYSRLSEGSKNGRTCFYVRLLLQQEMEG